MNATENTETVVNTTTKSTAVKTTTKLSKISRDTLVTAIDGFKKVGDKSELLVMSTSKFYATPITDPRAKHIVKMAQALFDYARATTMNDEAVVGSAIRQRLCEEAQNILVSALHVQHHVDHIDRLAAKIDDLRAKHAKSSALIAKLEAKTKK